VDIRSHISDHHSILFDLLVLFFSLLYQFGLIEYFSQSHFLFLVSIIILLILILVVVANH
jgi:hypothetical protein